MKFISKIFSIFVLSFSFVLSALAIDAPSNLETISKTNSSVDLKWDLVEGASMYTVYYWTESGFDSYYQEITDFTEDNTLTVENLEEWTYYFSVVAYDSVWEESSYSNELMIDINSVEETTNQSFETTDIVVDQTVDFVLESIEQTAYNKLVLTFSQELDNSEEAVREFKIINKADSFDSFDVILSEIDEEDAKKVELTLDRDTTIWNEYELVVIAINNTNWENIESGIDSVETFVTAEIEEVVEEEVIELNSAAEEAPKEEVAWPTGENIDPETIEKTTLVVAENTEKLPQTWPEHILMLILSIVLWALVFVFKFKKA